MSTFMIQFELYIFHTFVFSVINNFGAVLTSKYKLKHFEALKSYLICSTLRISVFLVIFKSVFHTFS